MPTHYLTETVGDQTQDVEIEFTIDSYGSPAHYGSLTYPGDPGDPPEISIDSVLLRTYDSEGNQTETSPEINSIPQDDLTRWENDIFDKWENYDRSDDYPEPDYD